MEVISIHAPRTGSDEGVNQLTIREVFQSTLPARGATLAITMRTFRACYFNPRSPHGERLHSPHVCRAAIRFQSTLPARGATLPTGWTVRGQRYFNPRSPHGERPQSRANPQRCWKFQSTLPARGATLLTRQSAGASVISIHAPRTGSDATDGRCTTIARHFNPRSPHGERRGCASGRRRLCRISIHAPRTGSDDTLLGSLVLLRHFNPRSPHGERPAKARRDSASRQFQSTLPARGATSSATGFVSSPIISIHAPRTGSDRQAAHAIYLLKNFNPRSPHGERPRTVKATKQSTRHFNPRSPHGERQGAEQNFPRHCNFNPRSPHGERRSNRRAGYTARQFQSTLPARGATRRTARRTAWIRAFQSTLPARGATQVAEASDRQLSHFNPRSPHGERPAASPRRILSMQFQSTLPARGATHRRNPLLLLA